MTDDRTLARLDVKLHAALAYLDRGLPDDARDELWRAVELLDRPPLALPAATETIVAPQPPPAPVKAQRPAANRDYQRVPVTCPECGKTYLGPQGLGRHRSTAHARESHTQQPPADGEDEPGPSDAELAVLELTLDLDVDVDVRRGTNRRVDLPRFSGPPPGRWVVDAECRGLNPDMFFPGRGESTDDAKAICALCPVRDECREYAIAAGAHVQGIWGGLSSRERRRLLRARRTSPTPDRVTWDARWGACTSTAPVSSTPTTVTPSDSRSISA